jgi:hypothetical protein
VDSTSDWRKKSAPIIAKILREYPERDADQERALREAYPFGVRNYHPYKVWLDEIKKQRNGRRPITEQPGKKLIFGSAKDPYGEDRGKA